ncbi:MULTISPECIES: histidine kinase [unclassified Leptolyngbya]|nr:histidine kinase [Leptolyngbya sp. FACHB-8]MBD2155544.1 histidine kinase [Leptolyngbya sp. FACHB-16]
METLPVATDSSEVPLQLLLFVDKRPGSNEKIRQIRLRLKELGQDYPFGLEVIDVGEQPHLVEHFKLVATPALIKYHPEPRHILAGSDIVAQLDQWWLRWRQSAEEFSEDQDVQETTLKPEYNPPSASISHLTEITHLSDEIFRLKQQNEELQEQLQFRERLMSMLAHDLRNPLTTVSIALETLELGLDTRSGIKAEERKERLSRETIAQLIRHARTQAKVIDRMITDVLQAAQGSGGKLEIQPQKLDLGLLCLRILNDLENQFEVKAQHIKTDIPTDLPTVYADPEKVRQVLINLLDNAIKYTPKGGSVQVAILHRTTQKVQVSVCDTGPGIPEENRERIFEDQFRLERDAGKDGYGIGLALCQRIVRAHYGQIWVDSTPSQGSCFHFTLPVYRS